MPKRLSNEVIEELIKLRKDGVTINDLSTKFNISISTIYKYLQRNDAVNCYREIRVNMNNKILELHNEGYNNVEIGKILGTSRSNVARILHKLGVPRKNNINKNIIERNKKIVEMYNTGKYTQMELANKFGLHRSSINIIISTETGISSDDKLLKRDTKIKELIAQGKSAKEISDEMYISKKVLYDNYNKKDDIKPKSLKRKSIEERNEKIISLYQTGKYSQSEIAAMIGLTQSTISNVVRKNK